MSIAYLLKTNSFENVTQKAFTKNQSYVSSYHNGLGLIICNNFKVPNWLRYKAEFIIDYDTKKFVKNRLLEADTPPLVYNDLDELKQYIQTDVYIRYMLHRIR